MFYINIIVLFTLFISAYLAKYSKEYVVLKKKKKNSLRGVIQRFWS